MSRLLAYESIRTPAFNTAFEASPQSLTAYMGVFFVAFLGAIVSTPIMRRLAMKNGVIDWPDLKRKNHRLPVAYLGGVAIFLGWFLGVCFSFLSSTVQPGLLESGTRTQAFPLAIVLGAVAITVTGLFDDVYGIRARVKIGGQLFAAAALTWEHVGFDLTESIFAVVGLSPAAPIVYFATTFGVALFVIGGCNAVNLIDGLDGLASGVVAIGMASLLLVAMLAGDGNALVSLQNPTRFVLCLAALGAILGFLPYNFCPARIFMGDAGSLLLGFLMVTAILLFGDAGGQSLRLTVAGLIIFGVPLTDTSLAVVRRWMRGQNIFAPDNQHLHHLLRKTGLSVRKSVLAMYAMAILFAAVGVAVVAFEVPLQYALALCVVMYGFIMVTAFKYGAYCIELERLQQLEQEQAEDDEILTRRESDESGPNLPTSPRVISRN